MDEYLMEPFRIRCICVNCRKESWELSIDYRDRQRKTAKRWFCGCADMQKKSDWFPYPVKDSDT